MRKITKELSSLVDLEFAAFWAHLAKLPVMEFLDDYLMNMRKYNDMSKVHGDMADDSKVSTLSTEATVSGLKREVNR